MRLIIPLFILFLTSCQTLTLQEFETQFDDQYRQLMELERPVLKDYFEKEEFNTGLQYHCMEPDKEPYNVMFPALPKMKLLMDEMQKSRGQFFLEKDSVLSSVASLKKINKEVTEHRNEVFGEYAHNALGIRRDFQNLSIAYDDDVRDHGILRFTIGSYADSLHQQVVEWQDSLEEQGRLIAADKSVLVGKGWDKRSEEFKKSYRIVSEMEALHKKFQSKILQMENLQNRYGSSTRKDEDFYIGPHLAEHADYDLHQVNLNKLNQMMQLMRDSDKEFHRTMN